MVDESEDEEAVDAADRFESVFNFRYEEEDGGHIVGHSRNIQGAVLCLELPLEGSGTM